MDNSEEMDKFLEKYNLPKLNQEEIENLNRSKISIEIETVIKNLPTNKSSGPDGFTGEFYQKFRDKLLLQLSRFSRVRLLCDPIDGSPTGSPVPGVLQARTLEGVAISFSNA